MKTVIIVQARMGSSRLPGKVMKMINGRPMIELIVKRLKKSKEADEVVVATSGEPENKVLIEHLKKSFKSALGIIVVPMSLPSQTTNLECLTKFS